MKNYESWMRMKEAIERQNPPHHFYNRQIWWASIGLNIGLEIRVNS